MKKKHLRKQVSTDTLQTVSEVTKNIKKGRNVCESTFHTYKCKRDLDKGTSVFLTQSLELLNFVEDGQLDLSIRRTIV